MKIAIISILVFIVTILLIVLLRTLLTRSTPAKTLELLLENDERAQEYGGKLVKMIQQETVSGRFDDNYDKFYAFHKVLEELFPHVHETCEKQVFEGSLLFKWKGSADSKSKKLPLLLMSHQDVVSAEGEWKYPPFSGHIDKEGRVWGRGAVDTKGSLFCIFTAIEELIVSGYEPECDIYIASSCTEEWSGHGAPLTAYHLKERKVKLGLLIDEGGMIIQEPIAGVKGVYGMVGVVEKGYGDVKFIARGEGGHASAPRKNSPLVRLGKFMADLDAHSPFQVEFSDTLTEMFRRLAPNMDFGMKLIFVNMWLFKPLLKKLLPSISPAAGAMLQTTLAFTTAKGSEGLNVLPQEAYVTGNLRFIHHQENKESLKLLKEIAKKYDIEVEVIYQDFPCPIVDYRGDAFRLIEQVAAEVYPGVGISPYVMTGGTDAKYYKDICDNCIRFAPLYINTQQYNSIHSANENIYQGALPKGVDFYKRLITLYDT